MPTSSNTEYVANLWGSPPVQGAYAYPGAKKLPDIYPNGMERITTVGGGGSRAVVSSCEGVWITNNTGSWQKLPEDLDGNGLKELDHALGVSKFGHILIDRSHVWIDGEYLSISDLIVGSTSTYALKMASSGIIAGYNSETQPTLLMPLEIEVVNRDEPTNTWTTGPVTSGPLAYTSPTISAVPDVKNGDLISWRLPGLTGGSFQWWATGPNGSRKDALSSVTTNEWKLEDPLDWLPGTWRIHCRYTPLGGAATEIDFVQKLGYRSPDITVLGWIDGTKIDLPAQYATLVPQTVNGVGANSIGDIMDSFTKRGSFLSHIGTGVPYTIPLTADGARQYVNAYLIKNSPNDAPPATFTTAWGGYPGRKIVDDQALRDFKSNTDKFRSFHRFQARFDFEDNGKIKGQPFYRHRMTEVGVTPVPWVPDPLGETGPHDRKLNTTGEVVQFNPKNGRQHHAALADDFEHYTQGRISTSGTFSGGNVSKNLNNLNVPWIWSIIEFDAQYATSGSTPIHEHEIFPIYHLYYNGVRLDQHSNTINRAIMEQFIQLGDNP